MQVHAPDSVLVHQHSLYRTSPNMSTEAGVPFLAALISGGIAGTSVDVALFPLDTIKTRLQSPNGFIKAGGFKGIYKGLSAAAAGSAPGAALFFSTYEFMKQALHKNETTKKFAEPLIHMSAASCGEVAACLVRVPTEVVKQRMQTGMHGKAMSVVSQILSKEGGVLGLYKGFGITIMREIPFAFIQFPIYEYAKSCIASWKSDGQVQAYEAAICGSVSGGIAAAFTTPLDVIKTRLMLGSDAHGVPYKGPVDTFLRLRQEGNEKFLATPNTASNSTATAATATTTAQTGPRLGMRIFLSGLAPRVMWISIGGFVFFGAYEQALRITSPFFRE